MRDTSLEYYQRQWDSMEILPASMPEVTRALGVIMAAKQRYVDGVAKTRVPWAFIAAIHYRESSNRFSRQILNGQRWDRKTTIEPSGLGPWESWEASTTFAITHRKYNLLVNWELPWQLFRCEQHNGTGYAKRDLDSPYVWAGTNHEDAGFYPSDGKFDPKGDDPRIGCAVILRAIEDAGG